MTPRVGVKTTLTNGNASLGALVPKQGPHFFVCPFSRAAIPGKAGQRFLPARCTRAVRFNPQALRFHLIKTWKTTRANLPFWWRECSVDAAHGLLRYLASARRRTQTIAGCCRPLESVANRRCLQTFPACVAELPSAASVIHKLLPQVSWPELYQPQQTKQPVPQQPRLRLSRSRIPRDSRIKEAARSDFSLVHSRRSQGR